jgi:hypothetical protein
MSIISFLSLNILFYSFTGTGDWQKEVIAADAQLNQYIIEHKVSDAIAVYDENFILTTSSGAVKKKQDMLNEIGLPDLQFEINETVDVSVRILENTAVLTGTLHQKGLYKQQPFDNRLLVTDTWVLVNGNWKLLAGHATLIKKT